MSKQSCLYRRIDADRFVKYDPATDRYTVVPADELPALRRAAPAGVADPARYGHLSQFGRMCALAMFDRQVTATAAGDPMGVSAELRALAHLAAEPAGPQKVRLSLAHGTGGGSGLTELVPLLPRQALADLRAGRALLEAAWGAQRERDGAIHLLARYARTAAVRMSLGGPWDEAKHPRGQPKNAGEFAPKGAGTAVKGRSGAPAPRSGSPPAAGASGTGEREHARPTDAHKHARAGVWAAVLVAHLDRERARVARKAADDEYDRVAARLEAALTDPHADPAAVERLRAEKDSAAERLGDRTDEHRRAIAQVRKSLTDELSKLVRNPARLELSAATEPVQYGQEIGAPTPNQRRVVDDAHAFVSKVCHWPGGPPRHRAVESADGRAFFYHTDDGEPLDEPVIALNRSFGALELTDAMIEHARLSETSAEELAYPDRNHATASYVHEIGHMIEARKPGVAAKARAFVAKRVKGEPPTKLKEKFPAHGFGAEEEGRKDHFDKAFDPEGKGKPDPYYVGKVYANGMTELVSMGLEKLYRDPGHLAQADHELFDFLVEVLTT